LDLARVLALLHALLDLAAVDAALLGAAAERYSAAQPRVCTSFSSQARRTCLTWRAPPICHRRTALSPPGR
jgi:hypothetical protein